MWEMHKQRSHSRTTGSARAEGGRAHLHFYNNNVRPSNLCMGKHIMERQTSHPEETEAKLAEA